MRQMIIDSIRKYLIKTYFCWVNEKVGRQLCTQSRPHLEARDRKLYDFVGPKRL